MNDATRPGVRLDVAGDGGSPQPGAVDVPLGLWGALVVEARHRRRLSQCALAEAAGVTQQSISKVESGDICPHDRLKVRLAAALDVSTSELFPWPATPGALNPTGGPDR